MIKFRSIRFSQDSSQRWISLWLFLLSFSLYVLSMGGHGYGGVGTTTYSVTRAMLLHGRVAVQQVPWGKVGPDGQFYAQYGIGHSLYNLPFYLIGHWVARALPQLASSQYDRITMFTTLLGQPCISALTWVLLFYFCRKLGYSEKVAFSCTLVYGLGTQAWMYAQLDFSEPLLTFWLLGAVYWIVLPRTHPQHLRLPSIAQLLVSGIFLGVAITVKIVAILLIPLLAGYLWRIFPGTMRQKVKPMAWFSGPVLVIGGGVVGWYNVLRFETPFETGYGNEFTHYLPDVFKHVMQNLAGLEGSIFFYSPVIILAFFGMKRFYRQYTTTAILLWAIILTFFGFYPFTTNELYYGPRYLTPTLPFFLLIAGAAFSNSSGWIGRVLAVCLFLGVIQQLLGVLVNYHTYYWRIQYTLPLSNAAGLTPAIDALLRSTPDLPHILGHVWLLKQAVLDAFSPGGIPFSGIELLSDSTQQNAWLPYYGLDLWWLHPKFLTLTGRIYSLGSVAILLSVLTFSGYHLFKIFSEDIPTVPPEEI